jgi:hypothetical protein
VPPFERVDVSSWPVAWEEAGGDSIKVWLREAGAEGKPVWLFKQTTEKQVRRKKSEGGGWRDYRQA